MSRIVFDEVDKLVLERWLEVSDLVNAYETVKDKLNRQLQSVEEALRPWAAVHDLELELRARDGEFWAYQKAWVQESKEEPWAALVVGGFSTEEALADEGRLYACVYCSSGKRRRLSKDAFGKALRAAVGKDAASWSEDTDRSCPLNRYAAETRVRDVLLDSQRCSAFLKDQLTQLAEFADAVTDAINAGLEAGRSAR